MKKTKVKNISAQTAAIKDYLASNPYCEEEELLENLKMTRNTLYHILLGLVDDSTVCENKTDFRLIKNGSKLQVKEISEYMDKSKTSNVEIKKAERLLYLYNLLHSRIPYGGVDMDIILKSYREIMRSYGEEGRSDSTVKRMIYRDIKSLEEIGIAINRPADDKNKKYSLKEIYLPKLPAESAAAVYTSMLLYNDTLLEPVIAAAREELEKSLLKTRQIPYKIQQRIYVVGDTLAEPKEFGDILGQLIRAVSNNFRIKIVYMQRDGSEVERILEPLGMICKRSVWYLIAKKLNDKESEIRIYRVDQIKHIYLREMEAFNYPEDFSLHEYIKSSWGVFCNDPVQKVSIKFSPSVAFRLKTIKYHPSQNLIKEYEDGSLLVEYEVCGLIEMQSWLMQWGEDAEVISPEKLRLGIRKTAEKILAKYNS